MANKKIKLKNATGDYLLPYTTNVPDASSSSKGLVEIEDTPTTSSTKALTSGGAKTALDSKLDSTGTAAKATADASGNVITTTYATKTELSDVETTANSAKSIAEGRARAVSYAGIETMVTTLNAADKTNFKLGDNIFLQGQNIPDLWVYSVEESSVTYTYTTDQAFITSLTTDGYVQVGYYKVSALESAKVDLSEYVPSTRKVNGKALSADINLTEADIPDIATTYQKLSDAISFEDME